MEYYRMSHDATEKEARVQLVKEQIERTLVSLAQQKKKLEELKK